MPGSVAGAFCLDATEQQMPGPRAPVRQGRGSVFTWKLWAAALPYTFDILKSVFDGCPVRKRRTMVGPTTAMAE
jgi:hypothetical protein